MVLSELRMRADEQRWLIESLWTERIRPVNPCRAEAGPGADQEPAASRAAFHASGSSSSIRLAGCALMRAMTSRR